MDTRRSRFVRAHPSQEKSEGWGTHFMGWERAGHPPAEFAHGMECGNDIFFSIVNGGLFEDYNRDPVNGAVAGAFLSYGCLQLFLGPEGEAFAWVDSGIRITACAHKLFMAVKSEDRWLKNQTEDNFVSFEVDMTGGVFGCLLTVVAAGLGED